MDLFKPIVAIEQQNAIFKRLINNPNFHEEKAVLSEWASGFIDRDKKFIKEFQTTFESSFLELYIYKILKASGIEVDFQHYAPDFVCNKKNISFCIEATICNPEINGSHAYGFNHIDSIDFKEFNRKSIIRTANAIVNKSNKYKKDYSKLNHVQEKPFILALNSFDRPHSHLIGNRAMFAALFGLYFNEEKAVSSGLNYIPKEKMDYIEKDNGSKIELGFFTKDEFKHISAIIYNPYANIGKIHALARKNDNNKNYVFTAIHHNPYDKESGKPKTFSKEKYGESVFDGMYIFHNPFATYPLPSNLFDHPKIANITINKEGNIIEDISGIFLLSRNVSVITST